MTNNELQRTEQWFADRIGKVTASRLYDVIAKKRTGEYTAAREVYLNEIILERLTGVSEEVFINKAMQRGIDYEPKAKEAYMLKTMHEIEDVGFINHPTIPNFGASPDGLILDMFGQPLNKGIEIKCPTRSTHLRTLWKSDISPKYLYQMYGQMMVTGFDSWVFMSYDDRFPTHLRSVIIEVSITDEIKAEIEEEVNKFNAEVADIVEALMNRKEEEIWAA
ncbi:YqaJ viral recombinase family protein [Wohlfahrtiimonas chitiniclastica]|uniref:lambda exonuclease family protein n=1 Tax=Wohlfahrtiimonas chitiniclastica TaxID=400946 RepID=UPI0007B40263|nr:lambda exonuclease family protein [Wohlfahrtiimonas chitiniclastica]KZS22191.1 hypothetical protein BMY_0007 [Wohlfahrtiimonas chitiniclastica]KZS22232.1 hypothetical protein BMY_0050 [Wohlfahrtiimonas chitiniclastica]KZS24227.1 hypothetical protein BMY_2110 [Wohlfahrtiimonas chitiniclastica]MBS7814749.1 YqaJ viral recombinase family protein [Wohlfahrtiimonas chitiniclastica]MBS7819009.1 YqaJ viral recombinase family protein [Wohlfahrtiimonas chitiniclastica]